MEASSPSRPTGGTFSSNKKLQEGVTIPTENIQYADMSQENIEIAVNKAKMAYLDKVRGDVNEWTDVARLIKEEMDSKVGPTWHCIVGGHYGSFCSYEVHHVLYFSLGEVNIMIYKYG